MKAAMSSNKLQVSPGDYYLEDLLKIYQLFESVSETVYIKTERYEFESFEEFRQFDGYIKRLFISIPRPFINVEIDQGVIISSNIDSPFTRGIIEQIGVLVKDKAKTRKLKLLMNIKFVILLFISALLFAFLKNQQIMNIEFAIFGCLLITLFYYSTRGSTIELLSKTTHFNKLKQNLSRSIDS